MTHAEVFPANLECTGECITVLCAAHPSDILRYIVPENTLTYRFHLNCGYDFWRVVYKVHDSQGRFVLKHCLP